jgi:hypothetical protein
MNGVIAVKFEKYVQLLLDKSGISAEHNLMYHRGRRRCQVDLEYTLGILFRKKVIVECKYIRPGNSLDFTRAYAQVGESMLFIRADEGIIATNAEVHAKEAKEQRYGIRIFDSPALAALRFRDADNLEAKLRLIEREIRMMPYSCQDSAFKHVYL